MIHIFSKHSVLSHITSDCRLELVSSFFWSLRTALNIQLHFTSGYYPKKEGQMEYTNQILEQYLWVYCNYQQNNWSNILPLVEFVYNNILSATTGVSLFFANKGYHLSIRVYLEQNITLFYIQEFTINLDELQDNMRAEIYTAQQ